MNELMFSIIYVVVLELTGYCCLTSSQKFSSTKAINSFVKVVIG